MDFKHIGLKYLTDKVPLPGGGGHHYHVSYDKLLSTRRQQTGRLLEIGIGLGSHYNGMVKSHPGYTHGSSLKLWREYFPNVEVHGWDVVPCPDLSLSRVSTHVVDATSRKQVAAYFDAHPGKFDVIVDDGSHQRADQVAAFMLLHDKLTPGGLYIIEDILPQNINAFLDLSVFPSDFVTDVIHRGFDVSYHDTRTVSGHPNDFIVCFEKRQQTGL